MDWDISNSTVVVPKRSNSDLSRQIRLKDYIRDIYISEFSTEWERRILDLIPRRDRRKHSAFIKSVLDEVKELYVENMKGFILKSILSYKVYKREHVACEKCNVASDLEQCIIEKDTMYDRSVFLKRRYSFARKYFLSYQIIQHVVNTAHRILPTIICDFKHYHEFGMLTLCSFRDMVFKDIKRSSLAITNQFYTETFKAVQKSKVLRTIPKRYLPQLMRCLTNVFVQQIIDVMMRSIDHIITIMRDACFCPQIKFQLVCENDHLVTKPDIMEVFSTYHDIIGNIETIAQDLIPLEEWLNIKAREKYIKISPPKWFIQESHSNLQKILDALFEPVNKHVGFVSAEFDNVCASSVKNRIISVTSGQPDFDAYLVYIHKYNKYLSEANSMLSNLYYNVGKLEQINAKEFMKQVCCDVVDVFTTELVKYHQDFNRSICSDFEDFKSAALDIPKDAESLIQLGEYMSQSSRALMKELEQKIRQSIYMLSRLLEITVLTDEHIVLNRTTINWLHDVQPIFAQNNTLCEAMKSELEEDLQRKINTLNVEVDTTFPQLVILDDMDDINRIGEYMEHYKDLIKRYNHIDKEMRIINTEEKLFKFPETEFPKVNELRETIVPFYTLICMIYQWRRDNSVWLNGPFECLDASVIEKKTISYFDEIAEMNKTMKSRIKMDATTNKSYKFSGIADDPDPTQQPAPLKLCWQVLNNINEFKVYLPLATCMCNSALESRHWKEMSAICNFDLTPNAGTTLKKMIDMNLMDNIDKYKAISLGANKELRLQQQLAEMIKEWEPISFEMSTDAQSNITTFKYTDNIEVLVMEHLVKIEEMRASHFVKPILSDVIDFLAVLTSIQENLNQWMQIQYRRLSLKPIFSYPGIATNLNRETSLYLEATKILLDIINKFTENPSFQEMKSTDLLRVLSQVNEKLEEVSRNVKDYLDAKRLSFTRFFFLEDSEIQETLFESTDTVKRHALVKKCFGGIERLKFNKSNHIQGIIGNYGDSLRLNNNVSMFTDSKCEEKWLIQLEKEMRNAIRENILQYYSSIDENWMTISIDNFPSMAVVCGFQLYWTSSVEKCLMSSNIAMLRSLFAMYNERIISITKELKDNLTRRHRSLLMSLIIVLSAHKEVIRSLLDRNITKQTDFEWTAQLKYYCHDKIVEIMVFDATIRYGYEYNYYQQNIVNTPLTDRCYRTIIQSYHYHLYSGIVGPTDTGKTETIKNLTNAIAKPFYILNCNDNIPYEYTIRIFKGVISCGAWICFENFNRLRLELLSAIAQNLTQIKQAVSSNLKTISFEGHRFNLNVFGNICININSERKFRLTDLPDNLRILFRSVSMMTPDINKIAEVELFAGGFLHAKDLATKLAVSYRLLSEHLEEKRRYNFGASSLKTVVANAISMKRNLPDENEYKLLLRSIIGINIPQLCNTDIFIFQSIMQDIFPECDTLSLNCSTILNAFESVCAKTSLTPHKVFKLKAIQIIELMYVRRALILIGDSPSGKTEILRTLAETLSLLREQGDKIGATVKYETIVPGLVSSNGLFSYFDSKPESWKDGLCTSILRRFTRDTSTDRKWLVFDGALSGTWTEHLYTVLDEDKTLYLASGERLPVTGSISIIFETTSMTEASPGIISRCGIIYVDSSSIGWRPYALSHIAKHEIYSGYEQVLRTLFDWAIDPCLNFLRENGDVLAAQELHLVVSTLNLFEILLRDACEDAAEDIKGTSNHFAIWAQVALILAIVWGLGGNLTRDSQTRFNAFCVSFWSDVDAKYPKPESIKHFDVTLPNEGLIQDNFYIFKGVGNWKYWGDVLKSEKIPEIFSFNEICIPHINSVKCNYIFSKHIKYRKSFLLYGDISVGKTCIVRDLLNNRLPKNCLANIFSFTSMITVTRTQSLLLSKLNKIRRAIYSPGRDRYCVNFVDDVSRAALQRSETRSVFELLRQLLSYGNCYDANNFSEISVQNIMFALAITTDKIIGSVPPRFARHFNTYTLPAPTTDNLFRIYSNVLFANLKKNLFAADVTGSVTSMVNATIDICESVIKTLRPTPDRLYYFFDMRDISKVISGCGLIQKDSVETKITFIRLWTHEILRVFGDRMLDENDREWLFLRIRDAVKKNFKDSFEIAFDYLPKFENNRITKDSFDDLMFGNFMNAERNGKRYEEISSVEALRNRILAYLDEYNADVKRKVSIVVSRYMLKSLIRISRILSIPGGNALMISTVGSGRRTTTALAAFMQRQSLFETTAESYYDTDVWKDNLRRVLRECGTLRRDVTYFMNERQMRDAFLSDICCLLSTGELPDLFSVEDRQHIIEMTRLDAQSGDRNAELSAREVMTYFVDQCRNRLHFVLCFSPTSSAYRTYLCSHPNLAKHCTVNCYREWPDQALLEIAVKHMRHVNLREDIKTHAARICVRFQNSAKEMSLIYRERFGRMVHVMSSAFLHMLQLYTLLMAMKQKEIVATRNRYLVGLEKLELAAQQVEEMKATLTSLKPQLELSARQTVITMKEVENENVTVEQATIVVKQEEEIANRKAEIAGTLKSECEADLAVAIPILEDAVIALNTLKPTDITLVKAMKNPPDTIKLVMAAVCVMLGVPPDRSVDPVTGKKFTDYWGPSKRILGDMNFLQNLKDYDKDDIAPAVMQTIKKTYMTDNSFMPHIVAKASSAAEGLCKWVRAMVSYDEVAKVVAPKKKKLVAAQTECDEAEAFLNEKRQTLAALNAKLAALHDSLRQTLQKKLKLETEVATCTAKLIKAEKLIASLGGEKSYWMQCARNLQTDYENLAGDMLLSCGVVAYMATYNILFRDEILSEWKKIMKTSGIPHTETYSFVNVLGVEIEINHWQLCGLSKNRFAVENGIILKNSEKWCLFIDSQNQINQWIKRIEKRNDLEVIKLTDPGYMSVIERNIENGIPVLLEDVGERLEIALEPILLKNIYIENEFQYIAIGNKSVKYSRNFRLYITTRLSNPNYTADVFSKLTIIDFSMPDDTLRDRLLDIVVSKERPELQEKFEALRIQDATNKKVLQQQEENILSTLSSTTTNILEDENAIRILDSSKTLTVDITKKQQAAKAMTESINNFRDIYFQFADHCAGLFCTLNTLSNLDHMYRFSFSWFIQLYITSIETSNRSIILEKRLQFLKSSFTRNLHSSVCRSLFEKHKLLYSFLLCVKVLIDTGQATQREVEYFISSDAKEDNAISVGGPEWLSTDKWRQICGLSAVLSNLYGFADNFRSDSETWKVYCNAVPFRSHPIPEPWADNLTRFQKLMLIKIIRRDKIVVEVMRLVEDVMGDVFNSCPRFQISESYTESNCLTPIIFILPSYTPPMSLVTAYANARGYTSKFTFLSMGDGRRGDEAEALVERARKEGGWMFLENCHHLAASSWLPRLERICENLYLSDTCLDFRLWLSSRSVPDFPISVLQNSVKIVCDYPLRAKQSLLRAYRSQPVCDRGFFEGCPGKDKEFSKLLYGLCLFHVIVKERTHFGPQGWSVPYDFDHMDFEVSARQLQNFVNKTEDIPFDSLLYLVGECNYGGKITNDLDQRCLRFLLRSFCNANIINDDRYSFLDYTEYSVPQRCEYRDVVAHINDMHLDAAPEVFAADENAVIVRDAAIAGEFLQSISLLDHIGPPAEQEVTRNRTLQTIDEINSKLPVLFGADNTANERAPLSPEPLNAILVHEIELIDRIVIVIADSLDRLRLALNGDVVMDDLLEDLAVEIRNNEVPRVWRTVDVGIVTKNLAGYVELLLKRADFVRDWRDNGLSRANVYFDALSCCRRFLTAGLLAFARHRDVPVERVLPELRVTSDDDDDDHGEEDTEDTYYIRGLHLSGARWDTRRRALIEALASTFWCDMPPIRLTFGRADGKADGRRRSVYECPLYVSPMRRDEMDTDASANREARSYIASVPLETDVSYVHWIKHGTALFCQIDA